MRVSPAAPAALRRRPRLPPARAAQHARLATARRRTAPVAAPLADARRRRRAGRGRSRGRARGTRAVRRDRRAARCPARRARRRRRRRALLPRGRSRAVHEGGDDHARGCTAPGSPSPPSCASRRSRGAAHEARRGAAKRPTRSARRLLACVRRGGCTRRDRCAARTPPGAAVRRERRVAARASAPPAAAGARRRSACSPAAGSTRPPRDDRRRRRRSRCVPAGAAAAGPRPTALRSCLTAASAGGVRFPELRPAAASAGRAGRPASANWRPRGPATLVVVVLRAHGTARASGYAIVAGAPAEAGSRRPRARSSRDRVRFAVAAQRRDDDR